MKIIGETMKNEVTALSCESSRIHDGFIVSQIENFDAEILPLIGKRAKRQRNLLIQLNKKSKRSTGEINRAAEVGNLSDTAHEINKKIGRLGLAVGCERPPFPILDRDGDKTDKFLWSIYLNLPRQAANDSEFNSDEE